MYYQTQKDYSRSADLMGEPQFSSLKSSAVPSMGRNMTGGAGTEAAFPIGIAKGQSFGEWVSGRSAELRRHSRQAASPRSVSSASEGSPIDAQQHYHPHVQSTILLVRHGATITEPGGWKCSRPVRTSFSCVVSYSRNSIVEIATWAFSATQQKYD
jgi:hypothetical protein